MSNSLMQANIPVLGSIAQQAANVSPTDDIGERFVQAYRISEVLQHATLIPDHLRGYKDSSTGYKLVLYSPEQIRANVMMVVNRALQWKVDPVALLAESFVVGGKLDFQGKVITAVVNKLGGLKGNLSFTYEGKGDTLKVIVSGTLKGEDEVRGIELSYKDAVTKDKNGKINEQWTKDVESKLAYSGAKKWARRHTPEVVLGLFGEDEEERPAEVAGYVDAPSKPALPNVDEAWRDTVVVRYEKRLQDADDRTELARLVDKIKSEPNDLVSKENKDYLVAMAKIIWKRKPALDEDSHDQTESPAANAVPTDSKNQDPTLEDKALHYEMMIQESDSPEMLQKWVKAIETDDEFPSDWKESLLKLATARERAGFELV